MTSIQNWAISISSSEVISCLFNSVSMYVTVGLAYLITCWFAVFLLQMLKGLSVKFPWNCSDPKLNWQRKWSATFLTYIVVRITRGLQAVTRKAGASRWISSKILGGKCFRMSRNGIVTRYCVHSITGPLCDHKLKYTSQRHVQLETRTVVGWLHAR